MGRAAAAADGLQPQRHAAHLVAAARSARAASTASRMAGSFVSSAGVRPLRSHTDVLAPPLRSAATAAGLSLNAAKWPVCAFESVFVLETGTLRWFAV